MANRNKPSTSVLYDREAQKAQKELNRGREKESEHERERKKKLHEEAVEIPNDDPIDKLEKDIEARKELNRKREKEIELEKERKRLDEEAVEISKQADIDTLEKDIEAQKELNRKRDQAIILEYEMKMLKEESVKNEAAPELSKKSLAFLSDTKEKKLETMTKQREQEQENKMLNSQPDPLLEETPKTKLEDLEYYETKLAEMSDEESSILLLGMVGSGKSSFIESLKTYSEGEVTNYLPKGEDGETNTVCLEVICFREDEEKLKNIEMWDTAGLQEEKQSTTGVKLRCDKTLRHIEDLIEGRIADGFDYTKEFPEEKEAPVNETSKKHCIVLACRAKYCTARLEQKQSDEEFKSGWSKILLLIRRLRMSPVVIITGCDEISDEVKNNPAVILRSYRVQLAISAAAKLFEVAKVNVLPVVNYTDQISIDEQLHQPLLYALYKIVKSGRCYRAKIKSSRNKKTNNNNTQQ